MRRSSSNIQTRNTDDVVNQYQNDLEILQQRISSLTGVKPIETHPTVSSSFVSGIRRVIEEKKYTDAESIERLPILEKVLSKITEYDREILKSTTAANTSEKSRSSSTEDDLFSLPAHLLVADRLMDLFTQSNRTPRKPTAQIVESKQSATAVHELRIKSVPTIREVGVLNISGIALNSIVSGNTTSSSNTSRVPNTSETTESLPSELPSIAAFVEQPIIPVIPLVIPPVIPPVIFPAIIPPAKIPVEVELLKEEKLITVRLNLRIAALEDELRTSRSLYSDSQAIVASSSKEISSLQEEIEFKSQSLISYQYGAEQKLSNALSMLESSESECDALTSQVVAVEKNNIELEGNLEIQIGIIQSTISILISIAANLSSDEVFVGVGSTTTHEGSRQAMHALSSAILMSYEKHRAENESLSASACSLSLEIADVTSTRNILREDYNILSKKNEKLENEIQRLLLLRTNKNEFDKVDNNNENDEGEGDDLQEPSLSQLQNSRKNSDLASQIRYRDDQLRLRDDHIKLKEEKIKILQQSLVGMSKQCADYDSVQSTLKDLYRTLSVTEEDKKSLKIEISRLNEEVLTHKNVIDSLRRKVRDMTGKDAAFLDTFEEVMHDEMLAMKWAFEAKLRIAKDKVDAMSTRHALEINRMQES